jgi:hypothetical protein
MLTEAQIEALPIDGELLDDNEQLEEAAGPDLCLPDSVDQARVLDALYKDLLRGDHARQVLAEAETRKLAEFQAGIEHRSIEGLGDLIASVPLSVYLYWVAREGPSFWHQRSNVDYLAKRAGGVGNPGILAKTVHKTMVMVDKPLPADAQSSAAGHEKPAAAKGLVAAVPSAPKLGRRGRWAA